jgi:hypothetical protein
MKQLELELSDPPRPPRRRRAAALESFHVQSHMPVDEVLAGEREAARQEAAILGYFETFRRTTLVAGGVPGRFTPSEVAGMFPDWPITSIRRAMTNLTTRGKLVHHRKDRRPGPHGAKESTWSLA